MSNKKVLIVTYYWPPNGGSGVQRWLKFVKYLPSTGWTPIVFTPANSSYSIKDESLSKDIPPETEVVSIPIWEPYDLFLKMSALTGKKGAQPSDFIATGKKSFFQRASTWIRGNFFIPDPRMFWIRPAVKFLQDYIQKNGIERIVTTGPPHSMHLIGLRLKKKNPALKWIADFRDPWTEWDLMDTLSLTSVARNYHRALERQVLKFADVVITISPYYVNRFKELGGRRVELITNGFDEDDFRNIPRVKTERFTIRHVGNVDELRDPKPVMEAIRQLCLENAELESSLWIEFIGNVNQSFKTFVAGDALLSRVTRFIDHMPHSTLVSLYGSTDLQLLILAHNALASGNIPGKVFEYLASGNPILAVGSGDGDVAGILKQTKAGEVFERTDLSGMKNALLNYFKRWKNGEANRDRDVSDYSRKQMTIKLADILNGV
jgi:glycosyltransferase involved in cell wall biosynthesis